MHRIYEKKPGTPLWFCPVPATSTSHKKSWIIDEKNETLNRLKIDPIHPKTSINTHFCTFFPRAACWPCQIIFYRPIKNGAHTRFFKPLCTPQIIDLDDLEHFSELNSAVHHGNYKFCLKSILTTPHRPKSIQNLWLPWFTAELRFQKLFKSTRFMIL